MLWRALGHIERGSFIDIGAQDPIVDSVSLAFYERGWRGTHVEPTPYYADLLRQQRPGDTVIQAAVGNGPAVLRFFEIPLSGISTADADIAALHRERGFDVHEIVVPCVTLSAVFEASNRQEIHWLKIDVEGFEAQVLSSWGASTVRPWIVVVESTLPMSQAETHENWEATLVSYGYIPVYFDGLNRFYVSEARPEIQGAFRAPPNVFDRFMLNGTSSASFHQLIEHRRQAQVDEVIAQIEQQRQSTIGEIESLNQSIASLRAAHTEHEQKWASREQGIAAQLVVLQNQAAHEKTELERHYIRQEREMHRQYVGRESALSQRLQADRDELRYVQQDQIKREQALSEQADQLQGRLESLLRVLAQREQEVAGQLLDVQRQAAQETAELTRSHIEQERELHRQQAQREQMLNSRLDAGQREIQRLEQDCAQREREHAYQSGQSRHALESLLRDQINREQEISAQLLAIQQQAAREREDITRRHSEQEQAVRRQHAARQQALIQEHLAAKEAARQQEQEWKREEKVLAEEIAALRAETQALQCGQQLRAQQHDAELVAQLEEHNRLIDACVALEAQLRAEIWAEQQTNLRLRQSLVHVQESLEETCSSITWRMTAPLRKLLTVFSLVKKNRDLSWTITGMMASAEESQSMETSTECPASTVANSATSHLAEKAPEEDFVPRSVTSTISKSSDCNASIEPIMLFSTQVIDKTNPAVANTLIELLACHDQQFVLCAYQTLLGRSPDPDGLKYYLGRLRAGISKIQLLKQLRTSSEGKAHAAELMGLDAAIQRHQTGQIPVIGWLFRMRGDAGSSGALERELRSIENQLYLLRDESSRRFTQLEAAIAGLQNLVLEQTQSVVTSLGRTPSTLPDTPRTSSISAPESDGLDRLSPRAKDIYFQLKAAAIRAGKEA
ncbi:FkbM family methyltransferase [Paraburkholderia sediminicola]